MPTGRGWALLTAVLLGYLGAWRLGYVELSVLATGALTGLVLGRLALIRAVPLRVSRDIAPARVSRGDPALGVVTVTNTGRLAAGPLRAVDRCGADRVDVLLPRLPAGATGTQNYFLPTMRRGLVTVGPLRLTFTDPLGLFRRTATYGQGTALLVTPRVVALDALPSGRMANVEGRTSSAASHGTVTFHALREYVFGDDLRHIHWRTTARTGTLMVRQLVDASLPRSTVLLDTRADTYWRAEDFEHAVDVTASLALAALGQGFPVTIHTVDRVISAEAGRTDLARVMEWLTMIGMTPAAPGGLAATIGALRPGASGGSLTVVTGAAQVPELARLTGARAHFDRTVLARVGSHLPALPAALPLSTIDSTDLVGFATAWRRADLGVPA